MLTLKLGILPLQKKSYSTLHATASLFVRVVYIERFPLKKEYLGYIVIQKKMKQLTSIFLTIIASAFLQCKSLQHDKEKIRVETINSTKSDEHDDTDLLQKLISKGGTIYLNEIYNINKAIRITKDIRIIGDLHNSSGYSKIVMQNPDYSHVFIHDANVNLEISYIETTGKGLLDIQSNSPLIKINKCKINGNGINASPTIAIKHNGSKKSESHHINSFEISENNFNEVTVAFLDKITTDNLNFNDNVINNGINYVLRAESHLNEQQNNISFQRNIINGLTGRSKNKDKTVARVFQASALTNILYRNNIIKDVQATSSANYIYWHSGNLIFEGNECHNIISKTAAVHDKGIAENYTIKIKDNVFDQSGLNNKSLSYTNSKGINPSLGMININRANNVLIEKNEFIGLDSYALRISHPFHTSNNHSQLPKSIIFNRNTIRDINSSSVVLVSQSINYLNVTNNVVLGNIRNTRNQNRLAFIELIVTSAHKLAGIKNVTIDTNRIENSVKNYFLVFINNGYYLHKDLNDSKISNIEVSNNYVQNAKATVKFFKSSRAHMLSINNNNIVSKNSSYKEIKY